MTGVTLSRWTMSYFAAAVLCLLAAAALMAAGFGYPASGTGGPDTLVLVHLVAVGWLSLLMLGALFQFVPVLIARPIYSNTLPLPALIALVFGLAALIAAFLQLAPALHLFPVAAILLAAGFLIALWNLGLTLWQVRPLPLPAKFVAVGLVCAVATVALGIVFTLVLGGATGNAYLLSLTVFGIPVHAAAGLGGWLTFTAMGVSYRLLAMFLLAPEGETARSRAVLCCGTAALAAVILGGTAAICAGRGLGTVLVIAAALGLCALALYGADIVHLFRARKRRVIELNASMAAVALANLGAVAILSAGLAAFGRFEAQAAAVVYLAGFGWLTGLGLAKLYKIVAFVTWLECYGPVLGKAATPRVQDLVVEARAAKWFWLYFAGVWSATACLLLDTPAGFRAAAALVLAGTAGIAAELVRTRLVSDVNPDLRLPHMTRRPSLFSSLSHQPR